MNFADSSDDVGFVPSLDYLIQRRNIVVPQDRPYAFYKSYLTKLDHLIKKFSKIKPRTERERFAMDEQLFLNMYSYLEVLKFSRTAKDRAHVSDTDNKALKTRAQEILLQYEQLEQVLVQRYEELKQRKVKAAASANDSKDSMQKLNGSADPLPSNKVVDVNQPYEDGRITCKGLWELLAGKEGGVLLADLRSQDHYLQSRIICNNSINIPPTAIKSGLSANRLSSELPKDSMPLWVRRKQFKIVVLLDWRSSAGNPSQHLLSLRDILTKWDPGSPTPAVVILDGGFEEFLNTYPRSVTNPRIEVPPESSTNTIMCLDDFEYPYSELESEHDKLKSKTNATMRPGPVAGQPLLTVDRSTKPSLVGPRAASPATTGGVAGTSSGIQGHTETALPKIPSESSSSSIFPEDVDLSSPMLTRVSSPSSEMSRSPSPPTGVSPTRISPTPPPQQPSQPTSSKSNLDSVSGSPAPHSQLPELRKKKPHDLASGNSLSSSFGLHSEKSFPNDVESVEFVRLKGDGTGTDGAGLKRSSSSPNIAKAADDDSLYPLSNIPSFNSKPSFSRDNKPNLNNSNSSFSSRFNHPGVSGLTGLRNFANNCYMNSIIQCLSNTEALTRELLQYDNKLIQMTNRKSRTKGSVALELTQALRSLWAVDSAGKPYTIKPLKDVMGGVKDMFRGSAHQDSTEFLIILLEYLHEDLNMPSEVSIKLVGAEEATGEKSWGEFRRKNSSVIQKLFYGQHRSTVTCHTCGHASITFDMFFTLFVPIPGGSSDVSLEQCLQLYTSGEVISGWKCPRCQLERTATKKLDITRLPPILVLALKRFIQVQGSTWLDKKDTLVRYPLDGLDMGRFVAPGSEQRYRTYDLHAMSTHVGTLTAGHYRAVCKNYLTQRWYLFDDSIVEPIPETAVRDNSEVYILFYHAV